MPIVELEPTSIGGRADTPVGFVVTPREEDLRNRDGDTLGFLDGLGSAFRQDNTVGASWSAVDRILPLEREENFSPWESIKGTKYEKHWDSFADIRNSRAADMRKRQIDQEEEDRRVLHALPWYKSVPAQIIAGGVDLPSLVPGGAFVRGAQGGLSIGRTAASVAFASGIATAGQEAALQSIQSTRSMLESSTAIGGSMLLGGILGAAGGALLSKAEWNAAVKAIDREINETVARTVEGSLPPASVGAMAVGPLGLESTAIAGRAASATAAATKRLTPGLRLMQSPNPATRDVFMNLSEVSNYIRGNDDGFASPIAVETLRKEWNNGLTQAVYENNAFFKEYRKAGGQLSRTDFNNQVGHAMRNADQHAIPEVARAAQSWRKNVFDPLKEAAIEAKLLPEDVAVDTAASYFSRMWNRQRLVAEEGQFKAVVREWVKGNMPEWARAYDRSVERRLDPLRREISDLEMAKLRRAEEARQREEGGEITAGDFSESDIRQAIRIVQGGAPKPKGVLRLTEFVRRAGGLWDPGGDVRHMGINNKTLPGMLRNERKRAQSDGGGWSLDDMARHAWESGYFPEHTERPSISEFLEALSDDFSKRRAVVRAGDRDAFRLQELIDQIEQDLARVGASATEGPKFSTSEEVKGIVGRVYKALDAEADQRIQGLRAKLAERETEARLEREARFIDDPDEAGREIADDVFATLTGRAGDGARPEFITINARGPLKERTFNIPDGLVERWLESDVDIVGRRYQRIMSSDVELARRFGSPDMKEALQKVREGYDQLRQGVTDPKELTKLDKAQQSDIADLEAVRDIMRGTYLHSNWERSFGRVVRLANAFQYILKMGGVVLGSLTEPVRIVAAKGLTPFMSDGMAGLRNIPALKMSIEEGRLAGNIADKLLQQRLATLADIADVYTSRNVVEKFMDNMTNVASSWNGIRLWTDGMKMLASTMIQNQILRGVSNYAKANKKYLAFVGIDESMAGRIAKQFAEHGEVIDGIHIAGTERWTDEVAKRTYRAALNKDLDSMVVTRGAADLPLFANSPLGKLIFQFNTFNIASHQRILMRGLQEGHARFLTSLAAMTTMGMFVTYLQGLAVNRKMPDFAENPGWWLSEGLDKSGVLSIPFQVANAFEKLTGMNPIKAPIKAFDQGQTQSARMANRNELGAVLGPTAGTIQDIGAVAGIPRNLIEGKEVTQAQKNAGERLLPFNSYAGVRQLLKYLVNPPE